MCRAPIGRGSPTASLGDEQTATDQRFYDASTPPEVSRLSQEGLSSKRGVTSTWTQGTDTETNRHKTRFRPHLQTLLLVLFSQCGENVYIIKNNRPNASIGVAMHR